MGRAESNDAGKRIWDGTVTVANFQGPPLIACCHDFADVIPDEFIDNPTSLAVLLAWGDRMGFPVIGFDKLNDYDGGNLPILLSALRENGRFCTPNASGPTLGYDGNPTAPVGVIVAMEPVDDTPPEAAEIVAEATVGWKRSHRFGLGTSAIRPVEGEDVELVQRPPIYRPIIFVFKPDETPFTNRLINDAAGQGSDPTLWHNGPYLTALSGAWNAVQPSLFSGISTAKEAIIAGIDELTSNLSPNDTRVLRHFAPHLASLLWLG